MSSRCNWVTADPLYLAYHDNEWGRPLYQREALFASLCLETQQAGLSWQTVLKKRDAYYRRFHGFVPEAVAAMREQELAACLADPELIRHHGKLTSIVTNAQALLKMEARGEAFVPFIWRFVAGRPQRNHWQSAADVPTQTPQSVAMSAALKARGFRFVGATTCYAFMQACGLVNDHLASCDWHALCDQQAASGTPF